MNQNPLQETLRNGQTMLTAEQRKKSTRKSPKNVHVMSKLGPNSTSQSLQSLTQTPQLRPDESRTVFANLGGNKNLLTKNNSQLGVDNQTKSNAKISASGSSVNLIKQDDQAAMRLG